MLVRDRVVTQGLLIMCNITSIAIWQHRYVIVICKVYVTAISLGCQYNAPDI